MLRLETETGFWLITHPDHAHLAAAFASHWGNDLFLAPSPRANVLHAIEVHDDGWIGRDAHPQITRAGKPSAFSSELVGKYSAFEEIDLADYLAVRESAVQQVEAVNPYAALLVSMHTYNLLTARADRSSNRARTSSSARRLPRTSAATPASPPEGHLRRSAVPSRRGRRRGLPQQLPPAPGDRQSLPAQLRCLLSAGGRFSIPCQRPEMPNSRST